MDDQIEKLLAEPDLIPLDSVPVGLVNRISVALGAKDAEIDKLRAIETAARSVFGNAGAIRPYALENLEKLLLSNDNSGHGNPTGPAETPVCEPSGTE